jgi:hypothetical protein
VWDGANNGPRDSESIGAPPRNPYKQSHCIFSQGGIDSILRHNSLMTIMTMMTLWARRTR